MEESEREDTNNTTDSFLMEIGLDNQIYMEPPNKNWENAWRVTEGLLLMMRDEVESNGASFLVVTISNAAQVHPDREMRDRFVKASGAQDLFYADNRLKAFGDREGIRVLNLAKPFQQNADEHGTYLHDDGTPGTGHWNETGHELAAQLIAKQLCAIYQEQR